MITRRQILRGAIASVAAPAIVRAELIMPVRSFVEPVRYLPEGAAFMRLYTDGVSPKRILYFGQHYILGDNGAIYPIKGAA